MDAKNETNSVNAYYHKLKKKIRFCKRRILREIREKHTHPPTNRLTYTMWSDDNIASPWAKSIRNGDGYAWKSLNIHHKKKKKRGEKYQEEIKLMVIALWGSSGGCGWCFCRSTWLLLLLLPFLNLLQQQALAFLLSIIAITFLHETNKLSILKIVT